jgi:TPR repeat protein
MEQKDLGASLLARAEAGDVEAQYELGWRHALGMELPEDDETAVKWLRRAASAGHAQACNNLGARHLSGEGVEADAVEAYRWFHLAAERGDPKARRNRDTAAARLTPAQIDEAVCRALAKG